MRLYTVVTMATLVRAAVVWADEAPHTGCAGVVGSVPREILERPVGLRAGLGNAHEVVTTSSTEAQAFYDQGLNYLHGYVWIEAARSFQQALRLDPQTAMAHVGLSRAYSGLGARDEAQAALEKSRSLAGAATPREQRRVALRAKQLEAIAGQATEHGAYKK